MDDREIDFVAERRGQRAYFQVAYLLQSSDMVEREFSVLESVPDNYEKYVLSLDTLQNASRGGIKHRNLIDFLLDEAW